jgi:hypothetical protein
MLGVKMARKPPTVLNFDSDVFDTRSALNAYRLILGDEFIQPVHGGKKMNASDLFFERPEMGIKHYLLPDYISGIGKFSIGEEDFVRIAYSSPLRLDCVKKHWESLGYTTTGVSDGILVHHPDGHFLAKYIRNSLIITTKSIEEFIENAI